MKLLQPRTKTESLAMLVERPEAVPIAGGTDLLVHWPTRRFATGSKLISW